jgi:hypothetical protein
LEIAKLHGLQMHEKREDHQSGTTPDQIGVDVISNGPIHGPDKYQGRAKKEQWISEIHRKEPPPVQPILSFRRSQSRCLRMAARSCFGVRRE